MLLILGNGFQLPNVAQHYILIVTLTHLGFGCTAAPFSSKCPRAAEDFTGCEEKAHSGKRDS